MTELDEIVFEDAVAIANPLPVGGRAVLGTATGLSIAALGAAAWSRMTRDSWRIDTAATPSTRWKVAAAHAAAAGLGTAVAAEPGTKTASTVGAVVGTALGQLPFLIDPLLLVRHPILGNIWQYGLPLGGALFGANVVR